MNTDIHQTIQVLSDRAESQRAVLRGLEEALRSLDDAISFYKKLVEASENGWYGIVLDLLSRRSEWHGLCCNEDCKLTPRPIAKNARPELNGLLREYCDGVVNLGPRLNGREQRRYVQTLYVLLTAGCRERDIDGIPFHAYIEQCWGNGYQSVAARMLLKFVERWTFQAWDDDLNAADAARYLDIPASHFRGQVRSGRIVPVLAADGSKLYRRSDLDMWWSGNGRR
ncbi:hypothetical protein OVY01_22745 [Robbsia sp. Bb-Pol-6]|uniref:Uncharacterized protein n=1 Tax=Robbsia betulipollinis TaxID=2981849 RepID=A0ABT3ZVN5_9BURK|nr:hypothetical protein [Robbsia betulipollinis]MCY0389960.1 hypothetical protein [Robbsia betulipollinis]